MRIARETWLLAVVCVADLVTTLWFVSRHGGAEANPMMRYWLEHSVGAFVLAKLAFVCGPLMVLEWARRTRPALVRRALRTAIVLYIGLYGSVVYRINKPPQDDAELNSRLEAVQRWANTPVSAEQTAYLRMRMR